MVISLKKIITIHINDQLKEKYYVEERERNKNIKERREKREDHEKIGLQSIEKFLFIFIL